MGNNTSVVEQARQKAERAAHRKDYSTAYDYFMQGTRLRHTDSHSFFFTDSYAYYLESTRRSADMLVMLDQRNEALEVYRSCIGEIHTALNKFSVEQALDNQEESTCTQHSEWHRARTTEYLLKELILTSSEIANLLLKKQKPLAPKVRREIEKVLCDVIAVIERLEGLRSISMAGPLHILAEFYEVISRYDLAVLMLRRCIGIQVIHLGNLHSKVLQSRETLRIVLENRKEFNYEQVVLRIQGFRRMVLTARARAATKGWASAHYHKLPRMQSPEEKEKRAAEEDRGRVSILEKLGLSDWDPRAPVERPPSYPHGAVDMVLDEQSGNVCSPPAAPNVWTLDEGLYAVDSGDYSVVYDSPPKGSPPWGA